MNTLYLGRYIDLFTSFGFKRVFGCERNKLLVIDFLNAAFDGRRHIINVIQHSVSTPTSDDNNAVIIELLCTDEHDEKIIVNVCKIPQEKILEQCISAACCHINHQEASEDSNWEYRTMEFCLIGLLDFSIEDAESKEHLHEISLIVGGLNEAFLDKLELICIEVSKFQKSEATLSSALDKWLFLLKNMHRLAAPPWGFENAIFEILFNCSEMSNLSRSEYLSYVRSYIRRCDRQNGSDAACKEAWKLGFQDGQVEMQLRIAGALKKQGVRLDLIAEATNLDISNVRQL